MKKVWNSIVYWFVERKVLRQRLAVRDSIDNKCQEELDQYKRAVIEAADKLIKKETEVKQLKYELSKLKIKMAFKQGN